MAVKKGVNITRRRFNINPRLKMAENIVAN